MIMQQMPILLIEKIGILYILNQNIIMSKT